MNKITTRTRKPRVVATMALGIFASLAISVTAFTSTAGATTSCPANWVCFWVNAGYSGNRTDFFQPTTCNNFPAAFNDKISSLDDNNGLVHVWLYRDANCPYTPICLPPFCYDVPTNEYPNLAGSGMNDMASSFKMVWGL